MNQEFEISDVAFFMLDGKPIATANPLKIEYTSLTKKDKIDSGEDLKFFNDNYNGVFKNVQISRVINYQGDRLEIL